MWNWLILLSDHCVIIAHNFCVEYYVVGSIPDHLIKSTTNIMIN